VESGGILVKGPYVAETFPVSIEEDYLVVET
jgi:3-phenylpropionate/trans-cinnamate dioxygenase ferredoxin subunit